MTTNGIPEVTWPPLGDERDSLWPGIEDRLGYSFRDTSLRDGAVMSAAWANEAIAKGWGDYRANKPLAWLGDSLINLYATMRILRRDFDAPTGSTTPQRQDMVSNLTLARAGIRVGLGPMLLLTSGARDYDWKAGAWVVLTATAIEALLGAIWIDVVEADEGMDPRKVTAKVYDLLVPDDNTREG